MAHILNSLTYPILGILISGNGIYVLPSIYIFPKLISEYFSNYHQSSQSNVVI